MTTYSPKAISRVSWFSNLDEKQIQRFKDVFDILKRPHEFDSPQVLSLTNQGIVERDISSNEGQLAESYDNYQLVEIGDFALNPMDLLSGWVARSNYEGVISNAYFVFRLKPQLEKVGHNAKFYEYVLQSYYTNGHLEPFGKGVGRPENGGGRWTVNAETLGTIALPNFTSAEQNQIVEYLESELALIDELVLKQSELVVLLEEKSRDHIESSVTGANLPGAMLATNDTTWPHLASDFKLTPLKYCLSIPITDGPHETPDFIDNGVEFISAEAVSSGEINFANRRGFISEQANKVYSRKYFPKKHDIFMIKSGATTGRLAILREERQFNIWSPLAALRARSDINPFYLHFALQSTAFQRSIALAWSFGTQQNIGMGALGKLKVPIPPTNVQNEIVHQLDVTIGLIKETSRKVLELQRKLTERRQALISVAISGKMSLGGSNGRF